MDVPVLLISAILGLGIGILSGMLGLGGGMMIVPLFRLGFAMEAIQATATSLLTIIPTSIAGLIKHIQGRTCVPPLGIAAGLVGALTSPLGVNLATVSPGWLIMLVTASIIAASALVMMRSAMKLPAEDDAAGYAQEQSAPWLFRPSVRMFGIGALVGAVSGFAAGFIGLGGGFIMVPIFVTGLGLPMKRASGTSLIAVCILAIPGAIQQLMLGNVAVGIGLAMVVGSIPGAVWGASLVKRLPERSLRLVFGFLLLLVALVLAGNELVALR